MEIAKEFLFPFGAALRAILLLAPSHKSVIALTPAAFKILAAAALNTMRPSGTRDSEGVPTLTEVLLNNS